MTAHTVLLAQTRVGFLTGGRKKSFTMLPEEEQMVQLEEAYARATVAITRARALCLILGPLDMRGLIGAATVMGTLMYGGGHVWAGQAHFYLHDHELTLALLLTSLSLICSSKTVVCQVLISLPQPLLRHCKKMSPITTKCAGYISLSLIYGGHGSTTLLGLGRLLTNFGIFLTVMTPAG